MYTYTDSTWGKAEHGGSSAILFILWCAVFVYLVISEILWRGLKVVLVWNELCEMCIMMLEFSSYLTKAVYRPSSFYEVFWKGTGTNVKGGGRRVVLVPHWIHVVTIFTQI